MPSRNKTYKLPGSKSAVRGSGQFRRQVRHVDLADEFAYTHVFAWK